MYFLRLENMIGLVGLTVLQSNALPFLLAAMRGEMPPTILPALMTIAGLACYLYRAVKMRDLLYIIGNTVGIVSNSLLIAIYYGLN
jgi:hypothetical protein